MYEERNPNPSPPSPPPFLWEIEKKILELHFALCSPSSSPIKTRFLPWGLLSKKSVSGKKRMGGLGWVGGGGEKAEQGERVHGVG